MRLSSPMTSPRSTTNNLLDVDIDEVDVGAGDTSDACYDEIDENATPTSPADVNSRGSSKIRESRRVSFQEKTDMIASDGRVDRGSLKEEEEEEPHHATSFDFDFRTCRIAETSTVVVGEHHHASSTRSSRQHYPLEMVSSYRKFAPRSQLPYVKRASI